MLPRLSQAFTKIVLVLALAWTAILSLAALIYSANFPTIAEGQALSEHLNVFPLFVGDSTLSLWAILGLAINLIALFPLTRWLSSLPRRYVILGTLLYCLAIQLLWIMMLNTDASIYADTERLTSAADTLLSGDYDRFYAEYVAGNDYPGYFSLYPFQAGSFLLFLLTELVAPAAPNLAFQLMNALANLGTVLCLYRLSEHIFQERSLYGPLSALIIGCLPLLLSCSLPYGNSLGLFLSLLSFCLLIHGLQDPSVRWAYFIGAFIAIAGAMLVKNTCVLFLIALVIYLVIRVGEMQRIRVVIAGLLLALAANQLPNLAVAALESSTGMDFGEGMPRTSWIALGLRDDNVVNLPGWWGHYPANLYIAAEGDFDRQAEAARESINESFTRFIEDPAYGFTFFFTKLKTEWLDPSYQSLYYGSLTVEADGDFSEHTLSRDLIYEPAYANALLLGFMDGYQVVIYLGAALGYLVILRRNKACAVQCLLPSTLLIGLGVYLLWEAKSFYLLPFFVILLPYASQGWASVSTRLFRRGTKPWQTMRKNHPSPSSPS